MASYMNSFFSLITYCNTQMINANEYNIARVILEHVNEIDSMSLENLSNESNISQASVSRFIKKLGYKNYQDFRESFKKALLEIKLNRKLSHVTLLPYFHIEISKILWILYMKMQLIILQKQKK